MKTWGIFTVIYTLIVIWLASRANDNMFGPDKKGTILIAIGVYVLLFIVYLIINKIRSTLK